MGPLHDKLNREREVFGLIEREDSVPAWGVSDLHAMVLDMFSAIIHVVEPPGRDEAPAVVEHGIGRDTASAMPVHALSNGMWTEMCWLLESIKVHKHRLPGDVELRLLEFLEKIGVD